MRLTVAALRLTALSASVALAAGPAFAARHKVHKQTAQEASCSQSAQKQGLGGGPRADFIKTCVKGPLATETPTAPVPGNKESQAVTKPSGVDRTTRTRQCGEEADRKHLADKERKAFQLSCLATAGPVSEGETGTRSPHPANQINGIGENNYKPSATTAKSSPARATPMKTPDNRPKP